MAKAKPPRKPRPSTLSFDAKPIKTGFLFDAEFMKRLRIAAAEHNIQLRDLVIVAVERLLADTNREGLDLHALVAKRKG